MEHNFKPGDRLRSLRSGRIWIVASTDVEPPFRKKWIDRIPVRDPNWSNKNFVWMPPSIFEKAYDL